MQRISLLTVVIAAVVILYAATPVKDEPIEISAGTTNAVCSGKGVYKWKLDGKTLSFELISDPHCQPRQSVLTGDKFSKQS